MERSSNLVFAKHVHAYLGEFIRAADQKAAFLLVAAAALLGWLATQPIAAEASTHIWKTLIQIVAMALVGLSAVLAVFAVLPRQHRIGTGLIAWTGILANSSSGGYSDAISKLSTDDVLREVASHSYSLAGILRMKYYLLWLAIWAFIFGGGASVVLLVLRLFVLPHAPDGPTGSWSPEF